MNAIEVGVGEKKLAARVISPEAELLSEVRLPDDKRPRTATPG